MRAIVVAVVCFSSLMALASPSDLNTLEEVFREIDNGWPNLDGDDYARLIARGESLMNKRGARESDAGRLFESRYKRCRDVWEKMRRGFDAIDEGVAYLTQSNGNGSSAGSSFDGAISSFKYAQRDWLLGTKDSCGESDAQRNVAGRVLTARLSFNVETWGEKAKQLSGLADERRNTGKIPPVARIKEAPRATSSNVAGSLPPKYVDNPQYGCGSLTAWQKTVTAAKPAGDPTLLPGCSKLDDSEEGGATVQVLSKTKKLVMELDALDHDNDSTYVVKQMKEKLERLERELQKGVWKSAELDPMAQSFERLMAWETNQMKAIETRSDIGNQINAFSRDYNEKTGKFSGKHYDIYVANAKKCIELIEKAQSDGVDLNTTMVVGAVSDATKRTYRGALTLCQNAKNGMAAKKKADAEAAAAEDLKWKTLCGGDKYKLWKAQGEFALSRGGWDRSRPEQACKADVWWSHHGPDDRQVYDCDKYTFSGNKQSGHARKSNRWFMACP